MQREEHISSVGDRPSAFGERRSTPRVALEIEVSLTSEAYFFVGLTGDVGAGGVFVPTYQLRPVGSMIDMEFTLPEGKVQARGRVRWVREARDGMPSGLGIAFESLADAERERIEDLCRKRSPIYYDIDD
jgi:uncharacterized protein (TIGR02266 family)